MKANYDPSETLVLHDEGSVYTNNPKDTGGPTRYGVTQAALSDFLGRPATVGEVRALTPAAVAPIYRVNYWSAVRADELASGLDYLLFDSAVQHGRAGAVRFLQQALHLADDGVFGPLTFLAMGKAGDVSKLIGDIAARRERFYRQIPSFSTFGNGWLCRLSRVKATAEHWATKPLAAAA